MCSGCSYVSLLNFNYPPTPPYYTYPLLPGLAGRGPGQVRHPYEGQGDVGLLHTVLNHTKVAMVKKVKASL